MAAGPPLVVPVMSEVLMKVVVVAEADPLMTWVVEVGDTPPLLMAPAAPDIAAFQLKVCTGIP